MKCVFSIGLGYEKKFGTTGLTHLHTPCLHISPLTLTLQMQDYCHSQKNKSGNRFQIAWRCMNTHKSRPRNGHTCSFYTHCAFTFTATFRQTRERTPDKYTPFVSLFPSPRSAPSEGMRASQSAPSHSSAGLCHVAFAGDQVWASRKPTEKR